MFRTTSGGCEIKLVEVERKTEKSVFISGSRNAIKSDYWQYWNSFDEAKEYLIEQAKNRIKSASFRLECAESFLKNVQKQQGAK